MNKQQKENYYLCYYLDCDFETEDVDEMREHVKKTWQRLNVKHVITKYLTLERT